MDISFKAYLKCSEVADDPEAFIDVSNGTLVYLKDLKKRGGYKVVDTNGAYDADEGEIDDIMKMKWKYGKMLKYDKVYMTLEAD